MLPPIGPVAPVINAVLPVSSNMSTSSRNAKQLKPRAAFEPGDIFGRTDRRGRRRFGNALDQAGEHLAGADFIKGRHARSAP